MFNVLKLDRSLFSPTLSPAFGKIGLFSAPWNALHVDLLIGQTNEHFVNTNEDLVRHCMAIHTHTHMSALSLSQAQQF